jgi:hypothetical protein
MARITVMPAALLKRFVRDFCFIYFLYPLNIQNVLVLLPCTEFDVLFPRMNLNVTSQAAYIAVIEISEQKSQLRLGSLVV